MPHQYGERKRPGSLSTKILEFDDTPPRRHGGASLDHGTHHFTHGGASLPDYIGMAPIFPHVMEP